MIIGLISFLLIIAAVVMFKKPLGRDDGASRPVATRAVQGILILAGLFGLISRSFVIVDANEVGHLNRIYLAADLPPGQIIAADGEKGPQAEILGPGFHFIPRVNVLYNVEYYPVTNIPEGQYGLLVAKDGQPLRSSQFISDKWLDEKVRQMLDATYFLTTGKGQKGPQLHVLSPGNYRINRYLFDIQLGQALDVPTGHVAVIRSNVQTAENYPNSLNAGGKPGLTKVATPSAPSICASMTTAKSTKANLHKKFLCPQTPPRQQF